MATNDKESSAAGTDNRPSMLEESDFESWKIRIERYIRGKHLGKLIWKSIKNGPTPHPTITVTTGEGNTINLFTFRVCSSTTSVLHNKLLSQPMMQCWTYGKGMQRQETSKRLTVVQRQGLMEAKEKGAILDAEAEAFLAYVECTAPYAEPLAITTTTTFEVSHEEAYDSDVDEAPHTAATFMANLMQTGPSTGQGTSNDTDFHSEELVSWKTLCRVKILLEKKDCMLSVSFVGF
nr:hypothetical protein [Tanacetum cinerariifolium]